MSSVGVMNSSAQALCTPDISCVHPDSTFGICPDSATGLPAGIIAQAYTVTMSIKIPGSTTVSGTTYPLTHLALTDVLVDTAGGGTYIALSNLGLSYLGSGTNSPSGGAAGITGYTMTKFGYWNAPGQSCVIVSGTPNKAGTFPIRIKSEARVNVGMFIWAPVPDNNNYRIIVNVPVGIELLHSAKFEVVQNAPNPFNDKTEIKFSSVNTTVVEFKVYDLLGSVVYNSSVKAEKGLNTIVLEANSFVPGVYMYAIKNGNSTITKRMVVSK